MARKFTGRRAKSTPAKVRDVAVGNIPMERRKVDVGRRFDNVVWLDGERPF
jgi:hypothetical protein